MKKELIIHPGIFEIPAVFKRVKKYAEEQGYSVSFHQCLADTKDYFSGNTLHLAHSAGYTCPSLQTLRLIYLVAPATNQAFWPAFFQKFQADIKDSLKHKEGGMLIYKNLSTLRQLLFNYPYWKKMSARYRSLPSQNLVPKHAHIILYENDTWSDRYDWSTFKVTRLHGHHDELLYRPKATLDVVLK